jgi:hypothetical protein
VRDYKTYCDMVIYGGEGGISWWRGGVIVVRVQGREPDWDKLTNITTFATFLPCPVHSTPRCPLRCALRCPARPFAQPFGQCLPSARNFAFFLDQPMEASIKSKLDTSTEYCHDEVVETTRPLCPQCTTVTLSLSRPPQASTPQCFKL